MYHSKIRITCSWFMLSDTYCDHNIINVPSTNNKQSSVMLIIHLMWSKNAVLITFSGMVRIEYRGTFVFRETWAKKDNSKLSSTFDECGYKQVWIMINFLLYSRFLTHYVSFHRYSRCQFHQHFTRTFFVWKCFSLVKFWQKSTFVPKNTRVKCWWNWPQSTKHRFIKLTLRIYTFY